MQQFNLEFKATKLGTASVNAETIEEAKSIIMRELGRQFTSIQFIEIEDIIFSEKKKEEIEEKKEEIEEKKEETENVVDSM